ncbi:MAG: hypothetical protein K6T88_21875 [Bacillus sp. (in: Bacteria)]|nr:hypothetical protein [Bacillus sp. (in: firmicutes)]
MGSIDDHAIDSLKVWFEIELEDLKEEWKCGSISKLSECHSYWSTNVYRTALNVLIKGCYLPDYVDQYLIPPISKLVKENW